jgi:hypothetical protein
MKIDMKTILDALVNTLMERFDEAGFQAPKTLTEKEREVFVFQTLEQAAILPQSAFDELLGAARAVVDCWENGDLADAVRKLDLASEAAQRNNADQKKQAG